MAKRAVEFTEGEFYHVYNRGIDKRNIFFSKGDWKHYQRLLYLCNSTKPTKKSSRVRGVALDTLDRGDTLVTVCAYAMMPNHFHLLLLEKQEGGISAFMQKLLTSFSMYMNKKYDRTGPLMCRPFRAKHVDSDGYFRWLISYIHMNPVDQVEPDWKEVGISDMSKVSKFLKEYKYSSYRDYFGTKRDESLILNKEILPIEINDVEDLSEMLDLMVKEAP